MSTICQIGPGKFLDEVRFVFDSTFAPPSYGLRGGGFVVDISTIRSRDRKREYWVIHPMMGSKDPPSWNRVVNGRVVTHFELASVLTNYQIG
jgi:hypothetical protein